TVFNTLSFLHYPDPQAVFQEVSRVLSPGGQFYLVDIAPSFFNTIPFSPNGIRFYSRQQRQDFGTRSGLHCQGHAHLLGNVLLSQFVRV
ncbi:MAG: class I SAM-dependent methyltransferase, partial [Prochlorothrix sp.]